MAIRLRTDLTTGRVRTHYPVAFFHVMLRGNGDHEFFFDDPDRIEPALFLTSPIIAVRTSEMYETRDI